MAIDNVRRAIVNLDDKFAISFADIKLVMIELIEELALAGGGYGLFSGCAAGDTAMAVVLRVG